MATRKKKVTSKGTEGGTKSTTRNSSGKKKSTSKTSSTTEKKTAAKTKTSTKKKTAAKKKTSTKKKTAPKKKTSTKKKTAPEKGAAQKTATTGKKTSSKKASKKKAPPKRKERIAAAVSKAKRRKKSPASASDAPPAPSSSKRNFGLRGAAPWVARHAAKHAEELRKRNAEPAPPGSARATLRVPEEAESIKSSVAHLHQLTSKIRKLRKKLEKNFFEIGELLAEVQQGEFFEAKGYSTFEAFLDRELDLPRTMSLRLLRISHTFQRETAYDFGLERLTAALAALDGDVPNAPSSHPSSRGWSSASLPPKPPIRYDD